MRLAFLFSLLPGIALAEPCPPVPDRMAEKAPIFTALAEAADEATARSLSNQLWQIWAAAPNPAAQALLDHGMARRSAYDFAAAVEAFSRLIEYCPDYAEGYNQRAFIRYMQMDYAEALNDLEIALELDSNHIGAMTGQALTLINLGRIEVGQAVLREALAMNPFLPERGYLIEQGNAN